MKNYSTDGNIMRIVIKIGTSTLAHPTGHLNIRRVEEMCKIISDMKEIAESSDNIWAGNINGFDAEDDCSCGGTLFEDSSVGGCTSFEDDCSSVGGI